MIILGIDPGTHRAGFGVINHTPDGISLIDTGLLNEDKGGDLREIKRGMDLLLHTHNPDSVAIEKLYFAKNRKTGIAVAEARGVILLASRECGIPICEYSPTEVKAALTGYGKADKRAVYKMVKLILREPALDVIDDAADALAVAITACQASAFRKG